MGKQQKERAGLWMVGIVIGLLFALATVLIVTTASRSIRVKDIAVALDPAVSIGDGLLLHRINIPLAGQTYGNPLSTKTYTITLEAEVTNVTDQLQEIVVYYYYDAGNLGFYSPGASSRSTTFTIDPNHTDTIQCLIEIQRPVEGASFEVGISAPGRPDSDDKTPGEFSKNFDIEFVQ